MAQPAIIEEKEQSIEQDSSAIATLEAFSFSVDVMDREAVSNLEVEALACQGGNCTQCRSSSSN